jgi:hypothetical protein
MMDEPDLKVKIEKAPEGPFHMGELVISGLGLEAILEHHDPVHVNTWCGGFRLDQHMIPMPPEVVVLDLHFRSPSWTYRRFYTQTYQPPGTPRKATQDDVALRPDSG